MRAKWTFEMIMIGKTLRNSEKEYFYKEKNFKNWVFFSFLLTMILMNKNYEMNYEIRINIIKTKYELWNLQRRHLFIYYIYELERNKYKWYKYNHEK